MPRQNQYAQPEGVMPDTSKHKTFQNKTDDAFVCVLALAGRCCYARILAVLLRVALTFIASESSR